MNSNQKRADVALLLSDKMTKSKAVTRVKEGVI